MNVEEQKIRYLIVNSKYSSKEKKELIKYFNKLISQRDKLKAYYLSIRKGE